jgi:hypothetical protein
VANRGASSEDSPVEPTFPGTRRRPDDRVTQHNRSDAWVVALGFVAALSAGCGETTISIVDRPGGSAGTSGRGGVGGAGSGGRAAGGAGSGGAANLCRDDSLCLVHHYTFDGEGTTATDVVGGADGTVVNTTVSDGSVSLAGGNSDQYVELPGGLISAWPSVTLEIWTTWNAPEGLWQRLIDFGSSDGGVGSQGNGETYLMISPRDGDGVLKAAFSLAGPAGENLIQADVPLSAGTQEHLAVVVDGTTSELSFYSNGTLVGSDAPLRGRLPELDDENSWLGRSQFELDVEYAGVIHDLRIFNVPRTGKQIAASFVAGPDALPRE